MAPGAVRLTKREREESISACDASILVQPASGVKLLGLWENGGVVVDSSDKWKHNGIVWDGVAVELKGSINTVREPKWSWKN